MYSKPQCGYCKMAADLLAENDIEFDIILVGKDCSVAELQEVVGHPVTTVPQIFINDKYVGGYSELVEKLVF